MGTHSQIGCHRVQQSSTFFAEHGYLQTPSLVQWMATLRCGLSCAHCLAVSREAGFADMPLEKVRGLIDEVAQMGVGEFLLTGGEPLVREDLGEVIEYLGAKGMSWTLNTAAMPGRGLREVISRHRPGFVAVSLDGPRPVHDAFRGRAGAWDEAMEAIRFFKSLEGVRVCAGTTVTSRNYDALDETFHLVTGSGADRWGIHLLVPEGRAADRPDLFLSKTQLKRLIKFVARRRRYFHVEMADEIGYLGYLEPLVRDVPLHCGAGRAQCVVLPDGEVVPCTTLDHSCSAGNVHERSLMQIWAEGFQDLRAWQPSGKCGRCEYAVGCRGGCWLQRKAGTQCFKEVWHVPGALKTAAGIAICLGGLAAPQDAGAAVTAASPVPPAPPLNIYRVAAASITLDEAINNWYFVQAAGLEPGRLMPSDIGVDWNEVAWRFFKDFKEGTLPQGISERCARVLDALETKERSLSLIALLWRAVEGPLFETDSTAEYSESQRQTIRDTLAAIGQKAQQWRLEIFENNLDPYLSSGRRTYPTRCIPTKAGDECRYYYEEQYFLSKDLNEERWGAGTDPDTREAAEAYLQDHGYAEQMDLTFTMMVSRMTRPSTVGAAAVIDPNIESGSSESHRMGPFDVLVARGSLRASFAVKGGLRTLSMTPSDKEDNLLDDQAQEQDLSTIIYATIEGGREYTYVELLNAVYQQNREQLLSMAYDWLWANQVPLWRGNVPVIVAVYENGALLWPAFREIIESDSIIPTGGPADTSRLTLSAAQIAEIHRRAMLKDIDFWMF